MDNAINSQPTENHTSPLREGKGESNRMESIKVDVNKSKLINFEFLSVGSIS
ncbi:MAG TPA: hypothetical protein PLF32_04460 [Bacteroidales bacterium]|nr:hypothetical protein [Bacteroidales bacterium]HOR81885.1 hypothetical protein [Bacteroidales bacterium]